MGTSQRDPKTGRFMPGNKYAVGNRGNRNPKWGNKNAVVTGEYERIRMIFDNGVMIDDYGNAGTVYSRLPDGVFERNPELKAKALRW